MAPVSALLLPAAALLALATAAPVTTLTLNSINANELLCPHDVKYTLEYQRVPQVIKIIECVDDTHYKVSDSTGRSYQYECVQVYDNMLVYNSTSGHFQTDRVSVACVPKWVKPTALRGQSTED